MNLFFYIILFIFGLAIGSFLNVVALRYLPGQKLLSLKTIGGLAERGQSPAKRGGRSACPHCRKTLHWYELIPIVSFFIQAGKCRSCGHKLSWQYPIVELLSGLFFVALPFFFLGGVQFSVFNYYLIGFWAVWILALLVLLLISLIDFRNFFVPDELILVLIFLGFISIFLVSRSPGLGIKLINHSFLLQYALVFSFSWLGNIWVNHLFAALAAGIFFGILFYFWKGKILGGGDVKLGFALGLLLGWPDILMALIIAFILGGLAGLILMITRKKTMKDFLPLAPFLAIGVALTVFFGYQIINGYFSLIGL
ncbi:MAG: prepilin peptidase [bacterium]|nr:prepilin peptidase [bacterium]